MSDKKNVDINSADWEDAIVEKCHERFPDVWELATTTEDEELFEKMWREATRLVVDDVLTSLIQKGIMEPAGMLADGDMTFKLTTEGEQVQRELFGDER